MNKILKKILKKSLPGKVIYAHCDIPCGIYDPKPAQIAAETVLKMDKLITALPTKGTDGEMIQARNSFVRMVLVKEEHARKCKEEILILWTDYFKPQHLDLFPNLHDTFWKAAKLCSKNKQEINLDAAEELVKSVNEIAEIFNKTKTSN